MANETILVVDADTKSQKVLEVSFKKAGYRVVITDSIEGAKRQLEDTQPDLIVSDTQLPDGDGFEFCAQLKEDEEYTKIPFVFLTEERSLPQKMKGFELGADEYLTKPIYIKEVTSRVDVLLQKQAQRALSGGDVESFEGNLSDITMIDLLQTIEQEMRTGTIRIERNHRDGFVYFREGNILDATCGKLQGEEALYRLMLWPDGKFEVRYHDNVDRADHIEKDSGDLLIEGIQRLEKWNDLIDDVPELGKIFEADYHSLPDLLERLPEEAGRVVRLFDGLRNLRDVIDDSPFDDVTTLQIVSRLFQEDVLTQTDQEETESIRTTANLQAWLDGPRAEDGEKMPFGHADDDEDERDPLSDTSPGVADAFNYEDEDSEAFEEETRPAQDSHPPLENSGGGAPPPEERSKSRKRTSSGLGPVSRDPEQTQWKVHWDEEEEAGDDDSPKSVEDIEEMENRRREEEARQIIRQSGQFNATKPQVLAVSRGEGEVEEADSTAAGAGLDEAEIRRREAEAQQLQQSQSDQLGDDDSTPSVSTEDEADQDSLRESTQEIAAESTSSRESGRQRKPTPIAGPGAAGGREAGEPVADQTSPGLSVDGITDEAPSSEVAPADQTSPGIQITDPSAMPDSMTDDEQVEFEEQESAEVEEPEDESGDVDQEVDDVPSSSSEMRAASVDEADAVSREAGESMRRSAPFAAVTEDEADADAEQRGDEEQAEEPSRRERRVTQEVSTSDVEDEAHEEAEDTSEGQLDGDITPSDTETDAYADDEASDDESVIEPYIADDEPVTELGAEPTPAYDEEANSAERDSAAEAGALFEMAEAVTDGEQEDEGPEDIAASAVEELGPEAEIAVERSAKDRELVTAEYDLSKSNKKAAAKAQKQTEEAAKDEQSKEAGGPFAPAVDDGSEAEEADEEIAEEVEEAPEAEEEEEAAEEAAESEDADEAAAKEAEVDEEVEEEAESQEAAEPEEAEADEEAEEEAEAQEAAESDEAEADEEAEADADADEEEKDQPAKAAAAGAAAESGEEKALSDHSHEASFFDEGEEGAFDYEFADVPETSGRWKHFVTVAVVFGLIAVVLVVYSNMSGPSDAEKAGDDAAAAATQEETEAADEQAEETVELQPPVDEKVEEEPFDPAKLGFDAASAPDEAVSTALDVEQGAVQSAETVAMAVGEGADAGQASADAGTSEADAGTQPTEVAANDGQPSAPEPSETTETQPEPEPEPEPEPVASASVDEAKTLLRRGKSRQALDMLQELSSSKPNDGEVAFLRGQAAYAMGRNSDAIDSFKKALNLGYTRASVYSELGSAYMVQGNRGEAKKAYQKYLEIQPEGKTADEIRSVLKNL